MLYKKILIAVDNSEYSIAAARKGLDLSHQLNAEAALVYVIDLSKAVGNVELGISSTDVLDSMKKDVEETLDFLAVFDGAKVTRMMPEGLPVDEIIKVAESWQADLIVMGTHGRSGLMHLLVGSVAEHVIRESKIPVLVVPGVKKS